MADNCEYWLGSVKGDAVQTAMNCVEILDYLMDLCVLKSEEEANPFAKQVAVDDSPDIRKSANEIKEFLKNFDLSEKPLCEEQEKPDRAK